VEAIAPRKALHLGGKGKSDAEQDQWDDIGCAVSLTYANTPDPSQYRHRAKVCDDWRKRLVDYTSVQALAGVPKQGRNSNARVLAMSLDSECKTYRGEEIRTSRQAVVSEFPVRNY
jgi:hypothetical protein